MSASTSFLVTMNSSLTASLTICRAFFSLPALKYEVTLERNTFALPM